MKKNLILFLLLLITSLLSAQDYKKTFLKGNITEKTAAVRQAAGEDSIWLSRKALSFIIENKDILKNDRDVEGLAVAAILSIPNNYADNLSSENKMQLMNQFIELFNIFDNNSTVQIAVQSKVLAMKDSLETSSFTDILNNYIQNPSSFKNDSSFAKSVIITLGAIGDNVSFTILYNYLNDKKYEAYYSELEQSVINLVPVAFNEVLQIVHCKDIVQINKILEITKKNTNLSQNFICEIAENVLNETIILTGNSSEKNQMLVNLQIDSLSILESNKWTRASSIVIQFFDYAKNEFGSQIMSEEQIIKVIKALAEIAPIDSVNPLIKYLEELNVQTENNLPVNESVVLSVINTLGAIGDKSAFDSLLSVTYLNYSESILSAAREALAGLRW